MRLSTRVALAAAVTAAVAIAAVTLLFRGRLHNEMLARVDRQLEERAQTAPILGAVGERLAVSEINATIEGARVVLPTRDDDVGGVDESRTVEVGNLPDEALPPVEGVGWQTVRASGENWRLHTVAVEDVPEIGDHTLVQFAAPLGRLDELVRDQRRSVLAVGLFAALAAAVAGYLFGVLATRPLSRLRRDAAKVGGAADDRLSPSAPDHDWRFAPSYGAVEVDEVAATLNKGLDQVAAATARRQAALESARTFTASATHELRTPLTSALADLDVARHTAGERGPEHEATITDARDQLLRLTATLRALRDLADAELADPSSFTTFDLGDQLAALVEAEARRHPDAKIALAQALEPRAGPGDGLSDDITAWLDGVRLAVGNLLRNAITHGRPSAGSPGRPLHVEVAIETRPGPHPDEHRVDDHAAGSCIVAIHVDDDGPGIPLADRGRLVGRFERGPTSNGSGLGLALVARIAGLHGGSLILTDSPLGGLRATLTLRTAPRPHPKAEGDRGRARG